MKESVAVDVFVWPCWGREDAEAFLLADDFFCPPWINVGAALCESRPCAEDTSAADPCAGDAEADAAVAATDATAAAAAAATADATTVKHGFAAKTLP